MGECDPEVGCRIVAHIREESLLHAERLRVAAERGEKMVDSFEQCLMSIQSHNLSFSEGKAVMERQKVDIDNLAAEIRRHALDSHGVPTTHMELNRDLRRSSGVLAVVICLVGVLYSVVLASPMGQSLLLALGKWLGVA